MNKTHPDQRSTEKPSVAAHQPGFDTLCMHFGEDRERHFGAAAPPIYQNSTFTFPDCESFVGRRESNAGRYDYTRVSNPTTDILEKKIARLEQTDIARAFGSGMAAIAAAIFSCVRAGDHIITIESVYGPTRRLMTEYLPKFGIETTYVRGNDVEDFEQAIRPNTRLIYLESPSSFWFEIQDMTAVSRLAKSRDIATICDNSNASPFFQNPVTFGVDLVVHSATKYIGGHSDLVAGIVAGSKSRMERLVQYEGELLGGIVDPFAGWLMLRGLRTLSLRLERQQRTASAIARLLSGDFRISRVMYSGSEFHPQAALARRQMRGHSGMMSFELRDPSREKTYRVVDALEYFSIGVSWGGYESLAIPLDVVDPATGQKTWLIRLSIGLESVEDLKADLYQALNKAEG